MTATAQPMFHVDGHKLCFPYGNVSLVGQGANGTSFRMVRALAEHAGTVVRYKDLAAEMWPGRPPTPRNRHAIAVAASRLNEIARDLGMVALITVAPGVGYSWSPTEEQE